jgi:hypothetical protein
VSEHPCARLLREKAAKYGTDVTVSTAPPVVAGPFTGEPFTCPHGITYWIEPTGEQIAEWVKDGTL